jgi:hypothetical protein
MDLAEQSPATRSAVSMTAIGIFLLFGALMASLAGATLVWRGTALDRIWALNPRAFRDLTPHGKVVGIPFLLLGVALTVAGIGWFKCRRWGWRLAVAIIATQVLGDLVNALSGNIVEGGVGVAIAGALLLYLLSANVRAVFTSRNTLNND